jgi:plastocyanin
VATTALGAGLVIAVALTAWLPAHAAPAGVTIMNLSYQPQTLTVAAGTTVSFANNDAAPHSVTADGGAFDSSPSCSATQTSGCVQPGQSFSVALNAVGTVTYHCRVHGFMHGTIVVTAASTTTSAASSTTTPTTAAPTTVVLPVTSAATTVPPPTRAASSATTAPTAAPAVQAAAAAPTAGAAPSGESLAKTGVDTRWPLLAAALLIGSGVSVLGAAAVTRRQRP